MEEDNSPDFLLPSNGGYNPKQKTMFVEEEESPDGIYQQQISPNKQIIKKPKSFASYAKMLQKNIGQMRLIKDGGMDRHCLKNLSKNHLK